MGNRTTSREAIPEDRRHDCYDLELLLEKTSTCGATLDCCQVEPLKVKKAGWDRLTAQRYVVVNEVR